MPEVTILANQSLSDPIDLGADRLVALLMPSVWTTAAITFQASDRIDGTYINVYDSSGNELTAQAAASRAVVDLLELGALRFIKLRSGTSGSPVPQQGNRKITIAVKG